MNDNEKKKIYNIEFLRFLFAVAIVVYHLFTGWLPVFFKDMTLYQHIHTLTRQADRAVDFFFIISGFFLLLTLKKEISVLEFLKKKIIRLWPMAIFAVISWSIIYFLGFISAEKFGTYDNIFGLFMINNIGITTNIGINVQSWYVSSLLLVLLSYFYFLKIFEQKYVNLIIAIITLFCYSYLIHVQNGCLTGEFNTYNNIFNVGIMRAFGGCGIGYFICNWFLNRNNQNKINIVLATGIEIFCILFLFYNMFFNKLNYNNDFIYILFFVILFIDFITHSGLISKFLENSFSNFIGNFSYSLYMSHRIVFSILSVTLWKLHTLVYDKPFLLICFSIVISILVSIIIHYLIEKPGQWILNNKMFK